MKLNASAVLLLVVFGVLPISSHAATLEVCPVGCTYSSVQTAIDAAAPGDEVLIHPASSAAGWNESLTINTANLVLRGSESVVPSANMVGQTCPSVVLDACDTSTSPGVCPLDDSNGAGHIYVTEPGVAFERLTLQHGQIHFGPDADNGRVTEVCALGGRVNGAVLALDDPSAPSGIVVERSLFVGQSQSGVNLLGSGHVIRHNQFFTQKNAIRLLGDDGRVENNSIRAADGVAIDYRGVGGEVVGNLVAGARSELIRYAGANALVTGNVIEGTNDDALYFFCSTSAPYAANTQSTIASNRVLGASAGDSGMDIGVGTCAGQILIDDNFIAGIAGEGIVLSGQNATAAVTISNNVIHRTGEFRGDAGVVVWAVGVGMSVSVSANQIFNSAAHGVLVLRNLGTVSVSGNTIRDSLLSGVSIRAGSSFETVVTEPVSVSNNVIERTRGEGVAVIADAPSAASATLSGNSFSGNRADVCTQGSAASATGGPSPVACVVSAED